MIPRPRVLLVDDHEVVRKGVRSALGGAVEVCGEAGDGQEAIEKVKELRPDVVLIDVAMPNINGIEAVQEISRMSPSPRIVFFTMFDTEQVKTAALEAGAVCCVSKTASSEQIQKAILEAASKCDPERRRINRK